MKGAELAEVRRITRESEINFLNHTEFAEIR
jgi:hypothetical protein